jgi:hypothetical protein
MTKSQPPNTFLNKGRTASPQPLNQYRPNFGPEVPRSVQEFARQTLDLAQGQREAYGPGSLFDRGNPTGVAIPVPAAASATDLGTSLGLSITLNRPGNWAISASVALQVIGDHGQVFTLSLAIALSPQGNPGILSPAADQITPMAQHWQVQSLAGGDILRLYIVKDGGGGTSQVLPANTTFSATWQGA